MDCGFQYDSGRYKTEIAYIQQVTDLIRYVGNRYKIYKLGNWPVS